MARARCAAHARGQRRGVREQGSGLRIAERLVERDGRRGLVVHAWTIAERWDDAHHLDVAVALLEAAGSVTSRRERLAFWPFPHQTLDADLRAAGLGPASSTYARHVERHLVTATRRSPAERRAATIRAGYRHSP